MGSALLDSWFKNTSNTFTVIDPVNYSKINKLYNKRVQSYKSISKINNFKIFDIIIFAIKPQLSSLVLKNFSNIEYKKNVLFISIVAGKKISFFKNYLSNKSQIIRVMPNMPALIGKGMSCLASEKLVSKKNLIIAKNLFNKVGKTILLKNENEIDKVTAISGSGPGYFFLFVDLLQKSALQLGLDKNVSKTLVYETAIGSIDLLLKNKKTAKEFLSNIAIKGGTTESAIKNFKKNNQFQKIIINSINKAYKRSIELSKLKNG